MIIIPLSEKNEPFDLNHINVNETVYFFYDRYNSSTSSTAWLNIYGNEKFVWNFDDDSTSGIQDQPNQVITGRYITPTPTSFKRQGLRTISLSIYDAPKDSISDYRLKYKESISFNVYKFPSEIIGADYVSFNSTETFYVDSNLIPNSFIWSINGTQQQNNTPSINVDFTNTFKVVLSLHIINGKQSKSYTKTITSFASNTSIGKVYESDVTPNLMFFNKEGDYLNFTQQGHTWTGEMFFNPNSSDTYKTIILNVMEKVDSFKYSSKDLLLQKFQLFNEYGMEFQPSYTSQIYIDKIESTNNSTSFNSKWLYAPNINIKYPLGTTIYIDNVTFIKLNEITPDNFILTDYVSVSDFNNRFFTIVAIKQGAIQIITQTDNNTFNKQYKGYTYSYGEFRLQNNSIKTINKGSLYCYNMIKIFNPLSINQEWNEYGFQNLIYDRKKVSIIGSKSNDGIYTFNLTRPYHTKYIQTDIIGINKMIPNPSYGFRIDLQFKTNQILLSNNPVDFIPYSDNPFLNPKNILVWNKFQNKDYTPTLLKPSFSFYFEQLDTPEYNFNNTFEVIQYGIASDILIPNTNDSSGYSLKINNYNTASKNITYTIKVNNSTYIYKSNIDFQIGNNISEYVLNLSTLLNNTVGLSVTIQDNIILIFEKYSYKLTSFNIDFDDYTFTNGALNTNYPKQIWFGETWYTVLDQGVDNTVFNGYIHHRTSNNIFYILQISGHIGNQHAIWYALPINKIVVSVKPSNDIKFKEGLISYCYSTSDTIQLEQNSSSGNAIVNINNFITNYTSNLNLYGLQPKINGSNFEIERMYGIDNNMDYVNISYYVSSNNYLSTSGTLQNLPSYIDYNSTSGVPQYLKIISDYYSYNYYSFEVNENLVYEQMDIKKTSLLYKRKIYIGDIDADFGFQITINGIVYNTPKNNAYSEKIAVSETLKDWGNVRLSLKQDVIPNDYTEVGRKYWEILENLGLLVWLESSNNDMIYDTIIFESKYPNINISYDIEGTMLNHKIYHSSVTFIKIFSLLRITINGDIYEQTFNTTITQTLNDWYTQYKDELLSNNIIVDLDDKTLTFSTLYESDNINYNIYVGRNNIQADSFYTIQMYRFGQSGIILSGCSIGLYNGADFQNIGFSTGMVTSLSHSNFPLNNQSYNIIFVDPTQIGLSYQGAFWNNIDGSYVTERSGFDWNTYGTNGDVNPFLNESTSGILTLYTKEYIRYPRERFGNDKPTQFKFSWEQQDDSMFFYDFNATQLSYTDSTRYIGTKPLLDDNMNGYLNKKANTNLQDTNNIKKQQTIFDTITHDLVLIDSETDYSPLPYPMQINIGYNSTQEGVNKKVLNIHRLENIECNIQTRLEYDKAVIPRYLDEVYFEYIDDSNPFGSGKIFLNNFDYIKQNATKYSSINQNINFVEMGFKVGQSISIQGYDWFNKDKQALFMNSGLEATISEVHISMLVVIPINKKIVNECSVYAPNYKTLSDKYTLSVSRNIKPPFSLRTSALKIKITVVPNLICKIVLYGQTEIEDDRFKVQLDNIGKNISEKDVYIFKEYDIKEYGIDWTYVNKKRKEMLLIFPEIYNYLGSYKGLINSINYFGYNDLQVNEYYMNSTSGELHKIEIPDIFDNNVQGWTTNDWLSDSALDSVYKKTKLSNLTYKITDFEGNYILAYSLDEIITKLLGLKKWLQKNVMPIGTKIRDITGKGSTLHTTHLTHDVKMNRNITISERLSPIDFDIESYLQPIENDAMTYNINIKFFTKNEYYSPKYFHVKITTFTANMKSVQLINLLKTDYISYNMAVNMSVDPNIMVEIISDNGYGATYSVKRSYSVDLKKYI